MGITNANKQINVDTIECDGELKATIALSASPDITENPTDIVLVLDRSGSMVGSPLFNMKKGAKAFVELISEATGGAQEGIIGAGSSIGVVSFATEATIDMPLVTSVELLDEAIDNLSAGGFTNHADAFIKAIQLFDPLSPNVKVIVMFTDGKTTAGMPPEPIAAQAKNAGIIIYCIGLIGSDGIDVNVLNEWATAPSESHVAITPDDAELEKLFKDLAANITKPGATDIVIDEKVNTDFVITSIIPPSKGTALEIGENYIQWRIDELGAVANEGATLEFYIKHVAKTGGEKLVNKSISYSDSEGNDVMFPEPRVMVECGGVVVCDPCPVPVEVTMEGCQDFVIFAAGDICLEDTGRILQLNATIKDVCPGKRVALAVIITEIDEKCLEHPCGMKTMTIPAHKFCGCKDVTIKNISFVLPEDLVNGEKKSACCERKFKVRFIANYIDFGYECCDLF